MLAETSTVRDSSLAVRYTFNGTLNDASGNGLHCTNRGTAFAIGRDRGPRSAVQFDGTSYLDCGDVLNDLEMPFTVTAWVWMDEVNNESTLLLATEHRLDVNVGVALGLQSGNLGIQIGDGGSAGPGSRRTRGMAGPAVSAYEGVIELPRVPLQRWVMVTGVATSPNHFRIYLNDLDVGGMMTGYASTLRASALSMRIGAGFKGKMDELRVYRRALTSDEIFRLQASPSIASRRIRSSE